MVYTVKQLAALSEVSVRTIRWYDTIGLLKPAYVGDNGYRYYEERELLLLQQILFFKELDFTLDDIRSLMSKSDFEILTSLKAQKRALYNNMSRINKIINSVDSTINHLRGNKKMNDKELYEGINTPKIEGPLDFFNKYYGEDAEEVMKSSRKVLAEFFSGDEKEQQKYTDQGNALMAKLIDCINKNLSPNSKEVQDIIHESYVLSSKIMEMDKNLYLKSLEALKDPVFKGFYDSKHPMYAEYMYDASIHYAQSL